MLAGVRNSAARVSFATTSSSSWYQVPVAILGTGHRITRSPGRGFHHGLGTAFIRTRYPRWQLVPHSPSTVPYLSVLQGCCAFRIQPIFSTERAQSGRWCEGVLESGVVGLPKGE